MKYGGTWFLSIKKDECKKKSWTSTAREYKYIVFSFISQFWWRNSTLYIYEVFMLKNYLLYELSNAAGQKSYVISKRDCQTRAKTRTIRLTDLKTYTLSYVLLLDASRSNSEVISSEIYFHFIRPQQKWCSMWEKQARWLFLIDFWSRTLISSAKTIQNVFVRLLHISRNLHQAIFSRLWY